LVVDDASEDDTVTAVTGISNRVRVLTSVSRAGYIVNRNRGFREASGNIVFSIDDDAYFSQPDIVSHTMKLFQEQPDIGAVAIPYIEPLNRRSQSSLRSPFRAKPGDELSGFIGCSHAVRKSIALQLGGYREFFIHQGEERDLCIRMREAGWRIVYGRSGYIVHMVSPKRDTERVIFYGVRNQIIFDVLNIPLPYLCFRLVWDSIAMVRYRFAWATFPLKFRAIIVGFYKSLQYIEFRQPVSRNTYSLYKKLPGHGPEEWDGTPPHSLNNVKTVKHQSIQCSC